VGKDYTYYFDSHYVLCIYSTLLHLPPLIINCIRAGIEPSTVATLAYAAGSYEKNLDDLHLRENFPGLLFIKV
jgi:hypothetical protein